MSSIIGSLSAPRATPPAPNPNSTPQTQKLYKECQQFEGILISNLWGEMEQGVSMSDTGSDPGAATMQGFGIQAAATGLASAGGLGIAKMIYQELAPRLAQAAHGAYSQASGDSKSST
ncbi:MAG TPA: rod-binding protein [Terriglobia bacterium]|nr:rod-binding protein [Terriglobia bacterium]